MAESEIPPVPKLTLGRLASQGQLVSSKPPAYFPLGDGTSANKQPHPFSYLNMCTKRPHNAQYRSSRHDGYAHFSLIALDHIPDDLSPREHGLKIHISLDDEIPGNVADGWNVVVNVLMQYNVARAKVVPSDNQVNLTKLSINGGLFTVTVKPINATAEQIIGYIDENNLRPHQERMSLKPR